MIHVMVPVLAVICPASSPAVLASIVQGLVSHVLMSRPIPIFMVIVRVTATNVTAPALAGPTVPSVPGLLLLVVVPVPGLHIAARVVLIRTVHAARLLAAVIPAIMPLISPVLIAGVLASPAMARVVA